MFSVWWETVVFHLFVFFQWAEVGWGEKNLPSLHLLPPACVHGWSLSVWDPIDSSPPSSSVHGISQARTLEWVVISSSRGSSRPRDRAHVSGVSCTGRWALYHHATWEAHSPTDHLLIIKVGTRMYQQWHKSTPRASQGGHDTAHTCSPSIRTKVQTRAREGQAAQQLPAASRLSVTAGRGGGMGRHRTLEQRDSRGRTAKQGHLSTPAHQPPLRRTHPSGPGVFVFPTTFVQNSLPQSPCNS